MSTDNIAQQPKPPIGLMPRDIWVSQRVDEIWRAIERYVEADRNIPATWMSELLDHQGPRDVLRVVEPEAPKQFAIPPMGWVLGHHSASRHFRYWCKDDKEGGGFWDTTARGALLDRDLTITPDPSIAWPNGAEPIISSEHRKRGDLYMDKEWKEWIADGKMVNAESFAWCRPAPPADPEPTGEELVDKYCEFWSDSFTTVHDLGVCTSFSDGQYSRDGVALYRFAKLYREGVAP